VALGDDFRDRTTWSARLSSSIEITVLRFRPLRAVMLHVSVDWSGGATGDSDLSIDWAGMFFVNQTEEINEERERDLKSLADSYADSFLTLTCGERDMPRGYRDLARLLGGQITW